jgi:hypothetical protein
MMTPIFLLMCVASLHDLEHFRECSGPEEGLQRGACACTPEAKT